MGGAPIKAGSSSVTVYVNKNPIPTAQIMVRVHEDIAPINNVWDQGERGLAGFGIILEDAGGKYGASAGIQSQDAFGNPLCTQYQYTDSNGNGQHDPGEPFVAGFDGNPIVSVPGLDVQLVRMVLSIFVIYRPVSTGLLWYPQCGGRS
ncbi:MAG: hypothetical protein R3E95_05480 [Thiolinea sp.]